MKTLLTLAFAFLFAFTAACGRADGKRRPQPVSVALVEDAQFPAADVDIMGARLCFLYGRCANLYGMDLGICGCAVDGNVFGLQLSGVLNYIGAGTGTLQFAGIANTCDEDFYGCQLAGIVCNAGGTLMGGQLAVFNCANTLSGAQVGVFNKAEDATGVQIGVINITQKMKGIQLGVVNIIGQSNTKFFPIVNMYF